MESRVWLKVLPSLVSFLLAPARGSLSNSQLQRCPEFTNTALLLEVDEV